ncbi:hypothetical protein [Mucilaginibacter sp. CSA2-8R]|uniref:hypothetical protein n=1 Tax=Mucilaginibacter sp. CSA2-8R TaxID=3141542 RepID=UPI00315D7594
MPKPTTPTINQRRRGPANKAADQKVQLGFYRMPANVVNALYQLPLPRNQRYRFITDAVLEKFEREGEQMLPAATPPKTVLAEMALGMLPVAKQKLTLLDDIAGKRTGAKSHWLAAAILEKARTFKDDIKPVPSQAGQDALQFKALVGQRLYRLINEKLSNVFTITRVDNNRAYIKTMATELAFALPLKDRNHPLGSRINKQSKAVYYVLETAALKKKFKVK